MRIPEFANLARSDDYDSMAVPRSAMSQSDKFEAAGRVNNSTSTIHR